MPDFTLVKLIVQNHEKDIFNVRFAKEDLLDRSTLLSTVIIGENGTGKSYLLTIISEIFRAFDLKKRNKEFSLRYDTYIIEYFYNGYKYNIKITKNRNIKILKDEEKIDIHSLILPKRVLAVSFMVNDKFTFASHTSPSEDVYKYLGIRRTSNAAWTTSIVKRVSDSFVANSHNKTFHTKIKDILEFLDFKPKISLVFEPTRKTLFTKKITLKTIDKKIASYKESNDFRTDSINKYKKEDKKDIQYYINNMSKKRDKITINNRVSLMFTLELNEGNSNRGILEDYKTLLKLIDLKLLNSPILKFYKDDEFEFEYASSGEKHLLYTLINIASEIEEGSIILIDEPELSLHPNWQLNYINNLKTLFHEYRSCHFIMATHSHYLVSDLEKNSSSIVHIALDKDKSGIVRKTKFLDSDTYAWSAENVLYNIFGVRTTRNYYFEMELRELVTLVKDKSENIRRVKDLTEKIKKYTLDKNDPLNIIITEVERYIKNVTDNQ